MLRIATTADGSQYVVQRVDIPLGGTVAEGKVYTWGEVVAYRAQRTGLKLARCTHAASKTFSGSEVTLTTVDNLTWELAHKLLQQAKRKGLTR
jgi:hypothetical protein